MSHDIKNNMLTCPDVLRVVFEKCDATSFTGVMFTNKLNYHVCDDILRERSEALVAAENGDADRLRTLFLQNNNASLTSSIRHPDHIRALIRTASRRGHASVVDVICDYAPITHNEVHEAAFGGNVSIVMKLIRRLLSSNVSCNGEVYALDGAIKTGNVELVKAICDNDGNRISRVVASSGTFEAFRRGKSGCREDTARSFSVERHGIPYTGTNSLRSTGIGRHGRRDVPACESEYADDQ